MRLFGLMIWNPDGTLRFVQTPNRVVQQISRNEQQRQIIRGIDDSRPHNSRGNTVNYDDMNRDILSAAAEESCVSLTTSTPVKPNKNSPVVNQDVVSVQSKHQSSDSIQSQDISSTSTESSDEDASLTPETKLKILEIKNRAEIQKKRFEC